MLLSFAFAMIAAPVLQEAIPSPMLPRWKVVISSADGEHAYDPQTLKRSGDKVEVFVRVRMPTEDGGTLLGVLKYRYDCKAWTARRLNGTLFELDGKQRGETRELSESEQQERPIATDSPNDDVAKLICPK